MKVSSLSESFFITINTQYLIHLFILVLIIMYYCLNLSLALAILNLNIKLICHGEENAGRWGVFIILHLFYDGSVIMCAMMISQIVGLLLAMVFEFREPNKSEEYLQGRGFSRTGLGEALII